MYKNILTAPGELQEALEQKRGYNRVISMDWLALWGDIGGIQFASDIETKDTGKHTQHFAHLVEIYDRLGGSEPVAMLQYEPLTPIFGKTAALIKFSNAVLYRPDALQYANLICQNLGFVPSSINRLDICADFQHFRDGTTPEQFMEDWDENRLVRRGLGDTAKVQRQVLVGDVASKRTKVKTLTTSASWGKLRGSCATKIYNKSKEMREVKRKPWIIQRWKENGFDMNRDTWRVEFSVKGKTLKYVLAENNLKIDLTSSVLDLTVTMNQIFDALCPRYFDFRYNKGTFGISKMPRFLPFKGMLTSLVALAPCAKNESGRAQKIDIRKRCVLWAMFKGVDDDFSEQNMDLAVKLASIYDLDSYLYSNAIPNAKWYLPPDAA